MDESLRSSEYQVYFFIFNEYQEDILLSQLPIETAASDFLVSCHGNIAATVNFSNSSNQS